MSMDLLEKLDKEITEQTRNGREDVYIDVDDLNELGYGIDPNKTGKVYVDLNYLRSAIKRYKFKGDLKVDIEPEPQTYREFIRSLRDKEKNEREK